MCGPGAAWVWKRLLREACFVKPFRANCSVINTLAIEVEMFKPHCNQPCNLQLLHAIAVDFGSCTLSDVPRRNSPVTSLARQEMQANAEPAAAPSDGAPSSEDPALIKMSNQHTKLGPARPEKPAPTKLDDQHNTQAMPVRTRTTAAAQFPPRPRRLSLRCQPSCADRKPVQRR